MDQVLTATATEMQNNFGRFLKYVMLGNQVIVTKNGKEVGRFIPQKAAVSSLTDSLTGILKEEAQGTDDRGEYLRKKYEAFS